MCVKLNGEKITKNINRITEYSIIGNGRKMGSLHILVKDDTQRRDYNRMKILIVSWKWEKDDWEQITINEAQR